MKTKLVVEFSNIFWFAEEHYGIDWNTCNDIFFNGRLEYTKHTSVDMGDWVEYVSFYDDDGVKDKAGDYTKEEVLAMNDNDKSYVITAAYLEFLNIKDGREILVDCSQKGDVK